MNCISLCIAPLCTTRSYTLQKTLSNMHFAAELCCETAKHTTKTTGQRFRCSVAYSTNQWSRGDLDLWSFCSITIKSVTRVKRNMSREFNVSVSSVLNLWAELAQTERWTAPFRDTTPSRSSMYCDPCAPPEDFCCGPSGDPPRVHWETDFNSGLDNKKLSWCWQTRVTPCYVVLQNLVNIGHLTRPSYWVFSTFKMAAVRHLGFGMTS